MEIKQTEANSRFLPLPVVAVLLCLFTSCAAEFVFEAAFVRPSVVSAIARMSMYFVLLYLVHRFAVVSLRSYKPALADLVTLHSLVIGSFILIWIGNALSIGFSTYMETSAFARKISAGSFLFSVPFASAALLIQAVLGVHYGLVFALSFSFCFLLFYKYWMTVKIGFQRFFRAKRLN